jgi:hydrogenase maturation protein HypF
MGRLFDAVSALAGICTEATYDGEPAIALEAALPSHADPRQDASHYEFALTNDKAVENDGRHGEHDSEVAHGEQNGEPPQKSSWIIDPAPVLLGILEDIEAKTEPALIAQSFHDAVAALIVRVSLLAREQTGITTVALSGGVFMNRYLCRLVPPRLEAAGFKVLQHRDLPANDGCIAYGQAVVAAARIQERVD